MKSKYLNQEALVSLRNYKYVSGEYSPLDHLMTPYWNKCVEFLPLWMAPNLVTLIGLIVQLVNMMAFIALDLTM